MWNDSNMSKHDPPERHVDPLDTPTTSRKTHKPYGRQHVLVPCLRRAAHALAAAALRREPKSVNDRTKTCQGTGNWYMSVLFSVCTPFRSPVRAQQIGEKFFKPRPSRAPQINAGPAPGPAGGISTAPGRIRRWGAEVSKPEYSTLFYPPVGRTNFKRL